MADVRIGISGWPRAWRGQFYPEGLAQKKELSYAAAIFRSIEINGSFYSMQRCESFAQWADATPNDFVFAVKGPRYLTHMLKLRNVERRSATSSPRGRAARSQARPDPVAVPAKLQLQPGELETSLSCCRAIPSAACGRRHDHRLKSRAWLESDGDRRIRHAMEIRHASFATRPSSSCCASTTSHWSAPTPSTGHC